MELCPGSWTICGLTQPKYGLKMRRMNQPTFLSSVLARLSAVRFPDIQRVAEGAGVPESTVRKLKYGEVKNPRVQTVQALHDYFERGDAHAAAQGCGATGTPSASAPAGGDEHA